MRRETTRLAALLPLLTFSVLGCENEPLGIEGGAQAPVVVEPSLGFREVTLDPFHPVVEAGGALQLTACWRLQSSGDVWPVTSPWEVTWISESPEVAEFTEDGRVKAKTSGLTTITATVTYTTSGMWGHSYTYAGSTPVGVR